MRIELNGLVVGKPLYVTLTDEEPPSFTKAFVNLSDDAELGSVTVDGSRGELDDLQPARFWEDAANRNGELYAACENQRDEAREQRDEARSWARHGYEIGQRHCGWTDHGVAPAWLTDGFPPHIDDCEHLRLFADADQRIADALAVIREWQRDETSTPNDYLTRVHRALRPPSSGNGVATDQPTED